MINRLAKLEIKKKIMISIIGLSIATLGLLGFISAEKVANMAEIEKVIKESVTYAVTAGTLPEPFCSDTKGKIPDHIKQKVFDEITKKCNEMYSSDSELLKRRLESYKGGVSWQDRDYFRALGGGIRKIENLTISIDGDRATAEADITKYTKLIESDGSVHTPEGTAHYKFSLIKEDGRWKIADEEFGVFPGGI
ncbi:MAG: DUF4101 domain-containing protein [Actinobacteria bacterium]|nr:DUF4101 domain-containing protein [Actinomycetota bacterium]